MDAPIRSHAASPSAACPTDGRAGSVMATLPADGRRTPWIGNSPRFDRGVEIGDWRVIVAEHGRNKFNEFRVSVFSLQSLPRFSILIERSVEGSSTLLRRRPGHDRLMSNFERTTNITKCLGACLVMPSSPAWIKMTLHQRHGCILG